MLVAEALRVLTAMDSDLPSRDMGPLVRAAGMHGYPALMRSLGHDPVPLLARCGLSEALLADEDRRVPLQQAYDLMRISVEATGLKDFGLRAARVQDIGVIGPLALAMQNAGTIRQSIDYLSRYLCVQSPALVVTLTAPGRLLPDTADLCYDPAATGNLRFVPQVVDHGLGLVHVSLRSLLGPRYALRAVSLPHPPVAPLEAYERFFGAPVHGAQPVAALHFAQTMLAEPVTAARPALLRMAADYLSRQAPGADAALAARARLAIAHSLAQGPVDKTTVAAMLSLHPRTLQRRLAAEGTSFEALRDAARTQAALRYLGDADYAIAQVSGLVGFSEQSAFTRFCRARLGDTPRAIRSRLGSL